nr:MAG TPA: hypothetical protein [Caudoviricetes sp.]
MKQLNSNLLKHYSYYYYLKSYNHSQRVHRRQK